MTREEKQNRVLDLFEQVTMGSVLRNKCPDWLMRPGKTECGELWHQVCDGYSRLTGLELPTTMPPRERRFLDAIWTDAHGQQRVIEYDEEQHFNRYRETTFHSYPETSSLAYDMSTWASRCKTHEVIRGGGFSKPKPPLFPMELGRNYQRAFRDMLADLLPPVHGWQPTMRIGHFEVESWMDDRSAQECKRQL